MCSAGWSFPESYARPAATTVNLPFPHARKCLRGPVTCISCRARLWMQRSSLLLRQARLKTNNTRQQCRACTSKAYKSVYSRMSTHVCCIDAACTVARNNANSTQETVPTTQLERLVTSVSFLQERHARDRPAGAKNITASVSQRLVARICKLIQMHTSILIHRHR